MSPSKMSVIALFLGSLATGVFADGHLTEEEHTETAMPQEIGTMTSDGFLVYEMNHCIVTMTTNCEVSLSTGPPAVETPGTSTVVDVPGVPGDDYPAPTGEPTDGEPGEGEPTGTDGEPTATDATNTGDITASETGDSPSPTDGEESGTATDSAATGTATAGAVNTEAFPGFIGMAGVVAAFLI